MKKTLPFLALAFILISCEEDFDPKTDYEPKYILSCIIRADTTFQTLTVSKSYTINGYDPYVNSEDPFLSGADIRVWQRDSVFFFKDSSVARTDTSRYKTPMVFYYLDNFKPAEGIPLEIRVITDNGKALWASTTLPSKVQWGPYSDFYLPNPDKSTFLFQWVPNYNYGWYVLRYGIKYSNSAAGNEVQTVWVPLRYNDDTPDYPKITKNTGYEFEKSALDRVMTEISAGDPDKNNYTIYGGTIELLVFDQHLSKYFSSINGFVDDYTIRVDQTDYTNVEGGLGIFGSYIKQISGTAFREEYITSFGYNTYP